VLKKNRKKKSRPVDTKGCAALVAYLQGIELKYTGRNSRYTFNAYTEKFGGTFFLLLKTFLEAVAEELHEAAPSDAKMKGLLDRSCPPSNKRPPKKP
jgi:hypothetical protein